MNGAESSVKKRSEQRQKGRIVPFRVSDDEHAELTRLADRAGLSVGSYVRSRSLEKPTTRAIRRPVVEVEVLKGLLGQVGKIGSNLNQLAKGVNQGATPLAADIQTTLAEIRQTAKLICDKMDGNT